MSSYMDREADPGWQYVRLTREELARDQTRPFDAKKNCWVPDAEEGYLQAEITKVEGTMTTVRTEKGSELTVKTDVLQVAFARTVMRIS